MVKKIIMVMALVIVWIGVMVKDVEADCTRYLKTENFETSAFTVTGGADVAVGTTICDPDPQWVGTVNYVDEYWNYYDLKVCNSDGSFTTVKNDCRSCTESGNGTAACANLSKCTVALYPSGKTQSISDMQHGCSTSNTKSYGVCDGNTGNLVITGECESGTHCENDFESSGGYHCVTSSCIKNGITVEEGERACIDGDVWQCDAGKIWMSDECEGQCIPNDDIYGAVCTGDESSMETCMNLPNGGIETTPVLPGRSICRSNKIYTCNFVPTFTAGTDCTANTDDGNTTCCTYVQNGVQYAKCDTAEGCNTTSGVTAITDTKDTVESTTSVYNPLCEDGKSIHTAFGCIAYDAPGFAAKILQLIFGIAGGIAFLLMVYGFILVATSSGDEKKLQAAKETITSAITGLLVCIFALLLFRLIVVNILQIPGIDYSRG